MNCFSSQISCILSTVSSFFSSLFSSGAMGERNWEPADMMFFSACKKEGKDLEANPAAGVILAFFLALFATITMQRTSF
jgi:hypothetical protein